MHQPDHGHGEPGQAQDARTPARTGSARPTSAPGGCACCRWPGPGSGSASCRRVSTAPTSSWSGRRDHLGQAAPPHHERPGVDERLVVTSRARLGGTGKGHLLSDRHRLAGEERLVHLEMRGIEERRVRGHPVAFGEHQDVAADEGDGDHHPHGEEQGQGLLHASEEQVDRACAAGGGASAPSGPRRPCPAGSAAGPGPARSHRPPPGAPRSPARRAPAPSIRPPRKRRTPRASRWSRSDARWSLPPRARGFARAIPEAAWRSLRSFLRALASIPCGRALANVRRRSGVRTSVQADPGQPRSIPAAIPSWTAPPAASRRISDSRRSSRGTTSSAV
jgi:hypothetical protein